MARGLRIEPLDRLAAVRGRAWSALGKGVALAFVLESDLSRPSLLRLENGTNALLSIFYP